MATRVAPAVVVATTAAPLTLQPAPLRNSRGSINTSASVSTPASPHHKPPSAPVTPSHRHAPSNGATASPPLRPKPAPSRTPAPGPRHRVARSGAFTPASPNTPTTGGNSPSTPNALAGPRKSAAAASAARPRYEKSKTVTSQARERDDRRGDKEREERVQREVARKAYEDANRLKRTPTTTEAPTARKKLIDRKPNLRVQTQLRPANTARDNSPYTPGGSRPPFGGGGGVRRDLIPRKAPLPPQAKGRAQRGSVVASSVPGSVEEDDGGREREGTSGHDRHQSSAPSAIPELDEGQHAASAESTLTPSTSGARSSTLDAHTLLLAATFLFNASHFHSPYHRYDLLALRVYGAYRHFLTRTVVFWLIALSLLLTWLEEKSNVNQAGLLAVECLVLLCLSAHTAVELWLFPSKRKQVKHRWLQWDMPWRGTKRRVTIPLWRDRWDQGKVLVLAISFLDLLVACSGASSYRVARPLRAYYLAAFSHDTRTQTTQVFNTIQAMAVPFVMVLLLIFFETSLAMLLFRTGDPTSSYFERLSDSFHAMFAVSTSSNFPDVVSDPSPALTLYCLLAPRAH